MSKFLDRLEDGDDGHTYYRASFTFGESKAEDPEGDLEGEFVAQVPDEAMSLSEENLNYFLKGWDLDQRQAAKKKHPNYEGTSTESLSEEEKEKRKEEFSDKMSKRHEVGGIVEEAEKEIGREITPNEVEQLLKGEITLDDLT